MCLLCTLLPARLSRFAFRRSRRIFYERVLSPPALFFAFYRTSNDVPIEFLNGGPAVIHQREPGCAVAAALGDTLDFARLENYGKLKREQAYLE